MTKQQHKYDELCRRAREVLGPDAWDSVVEVLQRRQAFSTALSRAAKAMDGPANVTDEQILGAYEIANEVWPLELDVLARAYYRDEGKL